MPSVTNVLDLVPCFVQDDETPNLTSTEASGEFGVFLLRLYQCDPLTCDVPASSVFPAHVF